MNILVVKDPDPSAGDYFTGYQLLLEEWVQLYSKVSGVPGDFPINRGSLTLDEYDDALAGAFQASVSEKGYRMLGRIWTIYQDVVFLPQEISELQNECAQLSRGCRDEMARSGLEKLLVGCEKARTLDSGLLLSSD